VTGRTGGGLTIMNVTGGGSMQRQSFNSYFGKLNCIAYNHLLLMKNLSTLLQLLTVNFLRELFCGFNVLVPLKLLTKLS
jgi:hypothetical protein